MHSFQPWLPLDGGNRTLVLLGAAAAAAALNSTSATRGGGDLTLLDFGGAVNLLYHPAGHSFFTSGLALEGLAPTSAGQAAGLTKQMVNGYLWPSVTGEAGHLMVGCRAGGRLAG